MWDYDPSDAKQLWEPGDYQGVIVSVESGHSKRSGKAMLTVQVECYSGDSSQTVTDYIVNPSGIWKLDQIAGAFGESEAFLNRQFDLSRHVGEALMCTLTVEKASEAKYADKNKISNYRKLVGMLSKPKSAQVDDDEDGSVPF